MSVPEEGEVGVGGDIRRAPRQVAAKLIKQSGCKSLTFLPAPRAHGGNCGERAEACGSLVYSASASSSLRLVPAPSSGSRDTCLTEGRF